MFIEFEYGLVAALFTIASEISSTVSLEFREQRKQSVAVLLLGDRGTSRVGDDQTRFFSNPKPSWEKVCRKVQSVFFTHGPLNENHAAFHFRSLIKPDFLTFHA